MFLFFLVLPVTSDSRVEGEERCSTAGGGLFKSGGKNDKTCELIEVASPGALSSRTEQSDANRQAIANANLIGFCFSILFWPRLFWPGSFLVFWGSALWFVWQRA